MSKEQSTEANPPMMLACGHVITKESLQKLSKPGGCVIFRVRFAFELLITASSRVKCPYCPAESTIQSAMRVYF